MDRLEIADDVRQAINAMRDADDYAHRQGLINEALRLLSILEASVENRLLLAMEWKGK